MSTTYAAWVTWLEAFRRGENPQMDRLGSIEGALGSYMEARLFDRLSLAVSERIRQWQSDLADRIVARPPQSPSDAAHLFRDAVERLEPLQRLASSPLLPRALAVSLHRTLAQVRDGAHSALDDTWRRVQAEARAAASSDAPAVPRLRAPQRGTGRFGGPVAPMSPVSPAAAVPAQRGGGVRGMPVGVPAARAAPGTSPRV